MNEAAGQEFTPGCRLLAEWFAPRIKRISGPPERQERFDHLKNRDEGLCSATDVHNCRPLGSHSLHLNVIRTQSLRLKDRKSETDLPEIGV